MKSLTTFAFFLIFTFSILFIIGCEDDSSPSGPSNSENERTFNLTENVTIKMVWIPAGSFMMGSPYDEQDRDEDEGPVHEVTIPEGFWLGKYEVTQNQWEAVMGTNPSDSFGVGSSYPVYKVSWNDIQDFLAEVDGDFRLPTEAEWEYACRAGTTTRYYWGDDEDTSKIDNYAVYGSNSNGGTSRVGTKRPNAWGLYDMSGNVYEWCEDWYHSNYSNAPTDGSAWLSPSGNSRISRGGGWYLNSRYCRTANRNNGSPSSSFRDYGFRLARSENTPPPNNHPPVAPSNPSPSDNATNQAVSVSLSWSCSDPDTADYLTYDVYLGTSNPPTSLVSDDQSSRTYDPPQDLTGSRQYYWKIVAKDNHGATASGSMWRFTTRSDSGGTPEPGAERTFPLGSSGEDIVMCWIPAGSFSMGSPDNEQDRNNNEGPVHNVTFESGFWLGKYEMTQSQWEAVMGDNPAHDMGVGDKYPVYYVNWHDVQGFESELGDEFRLPSESEWEYACRAGTDTRFYWGDDSGYEDIGNFAWYENNFDGQLHEIGRKLPNAWGLFDMSGNVYEWCEDWYHSTYNSAPTDGSAWNSPSHTCKIARSGCAGYVAKRCRSSDRNWIGASGRYDELGFRLARDN